MKWTLLVVAMLLVNVLDACPFCDSRSAALIRESLFGPDLAFNLVVTILPFIICGVIVTAIYRAGRSGEITPSNQQR